MFFRPRAESSSVSRPRAIRTWSTAHLWLAGLLLFAWVFLSVTPLPPNDLWWHMAAGRAMVAEGAWLRDNRWAYTLPPGAPYIYQSWLSEIIMYLVWRVGDVPLLALTRMVAIVGAYALMSWRSWRRTGGGIAVATALLLAMMAGWSNWTLRPQTLSFVPGAAFCVILGEYLDGRFAARRLIWLPLLMVLWVNLHGSFVLGVGLLGLAWLATLIDMLWARRANKAPHDSALVARLRVLTVAGVATGLAALIHPLGLNVFSYVRGMLTNAPSQTFIAEWQPPHPSLDVLSNGFWFFALLVLLPLLMLRGKRRPSTTDVLWFLALGYLALRGERYIVWFALLLMPLLADRIAQFVGTTPRLSRLPAAPTTAALAVVCVLALPWVGINRAMGAETSQLFASSGPYHTMLADTTPLAATEWLTAHPPKQRVWANMTYNSYMIWATPQIPVFVDQRVDMFPIEIWNQSYEIARGTPEGFKLLDYWNVGTLMLDLRRDTTLLEKVTNNADWCEHYRDRDTVIFERCNNGMLGKR